MRTILILTLLSSCTIAMSQEPTLESGGTNGVTTGHITQPYAPYVFPCLTGLDTTAKLYEVSIEIEDHSGDLPQSHNTAQDSGYSCSWYDQDHS